MRKRTSDFGLRTSGFGSIVLVLIVACGGKQPVVANGGGGGGSAAPVNDQRTPIEKRRDAACDQLGPKLTACAVEDAKHDLDAGKITKQQFDQDTATGVQAKNTEEFEKACKGTDMSSRQVRVLEVCFREEHQCDPLGECLKNLEPKR